MTCSRQRHAVKHAPQTRRHFTKSSPRVQVYEAEVGVDPQRFVILGPHCSRTLLCARSPIASSSGLVVAAPAA